MEKINSHDLCDNVDNLNKMKALLPTDDEALDISEFLRVFSDYSRVKILFLLMQSEMKVCDIAEACGLSHSATSHQLRVLKSNRLVSFRKEGKNVLYKLQDEHISEIIKCAYEHISE